MPPSRVVALLALVALGRATPAAAAPQGPRPPAPAPPSPVDAARHLYAEGESAFAAGRFLEAIRKFEAAYAASSQPKLLWNIGQSWRRQYLVSRDPADLRRARQVLGNYRELADTDTDRAEADTSVAALDQELRALAAEEARQRAEKEAAAAAAAASTTGATSNAASAEAARAAAVAAARRTRVAGLALSVIGAALVGGGAVLTGLAVRDFNTLDKPRAGYVFDPGTQSELKLFEPLGYALLGAGVAALGIGIPLAVVGQRRQRALAASPPGQPPSPHASPDGPSGAAPAASLRVALVPRGAGLALEGVFP